MSDAKRRFDDAHSIPVPHVLPSLRELNPLLEMADYEELDFGTFCGLVENQPLISSQIMRAARAIGAGRENGIQSLRHAVAIIGLRRVHDILDVVRQRIEDKEKYAQRNESYAAPAVFPDQVNLHRA